MTARGIVGSPDDLLRIELGEAAGSGHQWQVNALRDAGYLVLSDESAFSRDPLLYGAPGGAHSDRPAAGGRRWGRHPARNSAVGNGAADDPTFSVALALQGPEPGGLSRADAVAWDCRVDRSSIDLRPDLLPVRHQAVAQSCLAFASSTAHEHHARPSEHLSVEFLFYHAVARPRVQTLGRDDNGGGGLSPGR